MRKPAPSHQDMGLKKLSHPVPTTYQTAALTRAQSALRESVRSRSPAAQMYPSPSKKAETLGAMSPLGGAWRWPEDR
jgi:hypothetical protein